MVNSQGILEKGAGKAVSDSDLKPQSGITLPDKSKNPEFYERLKKLLQKVRDTTIFKELTFEISSVYRDFDHQFDLMIRDRRKNTKYWSPEKRKEWSLLTESQDIEEFRKDINSLVHDYAYGNLVSIMVKYDKLVVANLEMSIEKLVREMKEEINKVYPFIGIPDHLHHEALKDAFKHCYNNAFDLGINTLRSQVSRYSKNVDADLNVLIAKITEYAPECKLKGKDHLGSGHHFHFTYVK